MDQRWDIKAETLKLLEDNIGEVDIAIGTGKDIPSKTPTAQEYNAKNQRMGFYQIKICYTGKKTPTEWETILARELISRLY